MSREVDRRGVATGMATSQREADLRVRAAQASAVLEPGHQVSIAQVDATTGNPRMVVSTGARPHLGDYVQRALEHLKNIGQVLGLEVGQPGEFMPDPMPQDTSSGAVTVHVKQLYKGIELFHATQTVHFAPNGGLLSTSGSTVSISGDVPASPGLSAEEAVLRAVSHVSTPQPDDEDARDALGHPLIQPRVDLTGFTPKTVATFTDRPDSPTVLAAGPFGDVFTARLIWFPLTDGLRLAWDIAVTMPAYRGQYRTIVDANTGEILYCRQRLQTVVAQGNVFLADGSGGRTMTPFPRPLNDYSLPIPDNLPQGFPDHWVETNSTMGNCTASFSSGADLAPIGTIQGGLLTFAFSPADFGQTVLNAFYYCCYMHDFFYLLGFRETDGNFQHKNFGRGGSGADRVNVAVDPEPIWGIANIVTPIDGSSPRMNLGAVESISPTVPNTHAALDSSVVFHEFTHGVTNRLVGGARVVDALEDPQSAGMAEGWGDYIACVINHNTVVGEWLMNSPSGIRAFPYDSNFPDSFADLGKGRYTEVHNIGEIWCATLMEMTRNIDTSLALCLVVDALKLSPTNPSFLDMRDAILRALRDMIATTLTNCEYFSALRGVWLAFSRFGMGPNARSDGARLIGVTPDFSAALAVSAVYPTAGGILVACSFHGASELIKVVGAGGEGQNMFAVREVGGTLTTEPGYAYWLGTEQFSGYVDTVINADGETIVAFRDGRMLKVRNSGGTGQNMFAAVEVPDGFDSVPGYDYLLGSQCFGSAVRGVYRVADVMFVALADGTLVKVRGTGGTGRNMLAVREQAGTITGIPGFDYWVGTQRFTSFVSSLIYSDGTTIVGLADGRMLKVRQTGGGGQNMFAVIETANGFDSIPGWDYLLGSQRFKNGIWGIGLAADVMFVSLTNGTIVKVRGTGGTGQNMLAVQEENGDIIGVHGYDYWIGTQRFSSLVSGLLYLDGVTILGCWDGRMLKVQGTGGSGQNMFAVVESPDGFDSVPGYHFLLGSQRFTTRVRGLACVGGVLFVALGSGALVKIRGTGGTGRNMLGLQEEAGTITGVSGYDYWIGTQQF